MNTKEAQLLLDRLIDEGNTLLSELSARETKPIDIGLVAKKSQGIFASDYQSWYSEARNVVEQLLPKRLGDFEEQYAHKGARKTLDAENYRIEDYLLGLGSAFFSIYNATIARFHNQLQILKSCERSLKPSLLNIREELRAELFDSELETATALTKSGLIRCAGAITGVVLERHLKATCDNHMIEYKKNATINDFLELLRKNGVISVIEMRRILVLNDIRNNCDHERDTEPTKDDVNELISGVSRIIKTLH